jgi:hypothetical protein
MRIEGNDSRGLCDDKAAAPQADDEKHSSHAPILPPFVVLMAVSAVVWQSRSRGKPYHSIFKSRFGILRVRPSQFGNFGFVEQFAMKAKSLLVLAVQSPGLVRLRRHEDGLAGRSEKSEARLGANVPSISG